MKTQHTYYDDGQYGKAYVFCAKCKKKVFLDESYMDMYITHLGWLGHKGAQVHKKCLSEQRKKEIQEYFEQRKKEIKEHIGGNS